MIPPHFYFTFYRGKTAWKWTSIHTLALRSCKRNTGAKKIVVFYDYLDDSPDFFEARAIPGIDWVKTDFVPTVNGYPVKDQRLAGDVFRLQTLYANGGWYADLDYVFLNDFSKLADNRAVIGVQCKQKKKLNCSILGAEVCSSFIKAYLDSYKEWAPKDEKEFWHYANIVPWGLSEKYPVTVVPKKALMPLSWSNKTFWKGGHLNLSDSYAVHLWGSLHPNLTIEDLKKTVLKGPIEDLETAPKSLVAVTPGLLMTF
jgi:hypothetical protein